MNLSRRDLMLKLGILHHGPEIDPLTHKAYVDYGKKVWRIPEKPTTSFYASQFPGSKACGRKAIYSLLNTAEAEPTSPLLQAAAELGNAVESQIIFRWAQAGLLVAGSSPLWDGGPYAQVKFEDEETWLSGAADAILQIPDFPYILPVDIKSKKNEVIERMKVGAEEYDPQHYAQVQSYCYLATKYFDQFGWREMGLLPPIGGVIYYVSRDNPRNIKEFFIDYDSSFIVNGVRQLKEWKESYLANKIPERPKDWKWTEKPCQWCPFKKFVCKPDWKDGIVDIEQSHAHEFTSGIREEYDQYKNMIEVLSRWTLQKQD